jgi:hypothetical protein
MVPKFSKIGVTSTEDQPQGSSTFRFTNRAKYSDSSIFSACGDVRLLLGASTGMSALYITKNQFLYFVAEEATALASAARAYLAAKAAGATKGQLVSADIGRALSCRFPISFSSAHGPANDGSCQVCGSRIAAPAPGSLLFVLWS